MLRAIVFVRLADIAAVKDKAIVDVFPIFLRDQFFEVVGDFLEISMIGKVEFARKALDVRVGRDAFPNSEQFTEDDVGCFVADAGEFLELHCVSRKFAAKIVADDFGGLLNVLCLITEK